MTDRSEDRFWTTAFGPNAPAFGAHKPSPWFATLTRHVQHPGNGLTSGLLRNIHAALIKSPRTLVDHVYRDVRLRLSPAHFSQERALLKTGRHPIEDDMAFFDQIDGRDVVFVDIGANAGLYSLMAARMAGPGSKIIAIEPEPGVFLKLSFQITANSLSERVHAYECAIGDAPGKLPLYRHVAGDTGQNTLISREETAALHNAVTVPVRTLVDVLAEEGLARIDLLKIDVEGSEDRALSPFFEQAPNTLWPRDILLEIKEQSKWQRDLLGQLRDAGYDIHKEMGENAWLRLR